MTLVNIEEDKITPNQKEQLFNDLDRGPIRKATGEAAAVPTAMVTVEFNGKTFGVDEDGFLLDYNTYCGEWVDYVKGQEGIDEMTDEHWQVVKILQDYYERNGKAPMSHVLTKLTKFKLKHIYELFPSGPGKGACKMAGLPKPEGCV